MAIELSSNVQVVGPAEPGPVCKCWSGRISGLHVACVIVSSPVVVWGAGVVPFPSLFRERRFGKYDLTPSSLDFSSSEGVLFFWLTLQFNSRLFHVSRGFWLERVSHLFLIFTRTTIYALLIILKEYCCFSYAWLRRVKFTVCSPLHVTGGEGS